MADSGKLARVQRLVARLASDESNLESLPTTNNEAVADLDAATESFAFESVKISDGNKLEAHYKSAAQKIKQKQFDRLTDDELIATEAIIIPKWRPVTFVADGTFGTLPAPWTHLNGEDFKKLINPLLPSIGRIELPGHKSLPYGGTGFVVGDGVLMTNRHVAKIFCSGVGEKDLLFTAGTAAVDFKREYNSHPADRSARFTVESVEMIHPFWDMALLRVTGMSGEHQPLKLSVAPAEALVGREVVSIGYPARDDRNDLDEQDRIFQMVYDVKRLQPGKIDKRRFIRSFENVVNAMTHDATTLGGCSGSALIDVRSGEVLGLHFAGVYLDANFAVPTSELAKDKRVVRKELSFAGELPPTSDWDHAWERRPGESTGASVAPGFAPSIGGGQQISIPLQLNISLQGGTVSLSQKPVGFAAAQTEGMKIPIIYDGLENREGYFDKFLDDASKAVPLPELTAKGEKVVARLDDGTWELKYHKFSVAIHRGRRLALFTGANVDWRKQSRLVNGKKPTRKQLTGLGEGDIEKWVTDWRIPLEHQLPDKFYTNDGGAFDKGHLVRRDDVCWGTGLEDIQMGNGDTYHTTNCSPQTSGFNQASKGDENWGELENLVQAQTSAERALVFSGPAFQPDDPIFDGKGDGGAAIVLRIPRKFWKIVVVRGDKKPQAFGFVLEQDLYRVQLREEFVVPSEWIKHMESVDSIESMMGGLVSLKALKPFDQFDSAEGVQIKNAIETR